MSSSVLGGPLEKQTSPGMNVMILPRPSHTELFLTATLLEGEAPEAMLARVAETLKSHEAAIVTQDVFGIPNLPGQGPSVLETAFGEVTWPVTWLGQNEATNASPVGTQIWAVAGLAVEPLEYEGRLIGSVLEDEHVQYIRLGGIVPRDTSVDEDDQTRDVFVQMIGALRSAGMDFGNVVRTWFYNADILDWYDRFNKVRDSFFKEWGTFDGLVPASTGMGGCNPAGVALTAGLLAVKDKTGTMQTGPVPSPLQCPALEYGSSFSRASDIATPGLRRVFVSGTASIAPEGHTVHLDDTKAQVDLTMRVVAAILETRNMDWKNVTRAAVYFKHEADMPIFEAYCEANGIEDFPGVLMNDDVCRGDLLFEIEVDAVNCED